MIVQAYRKGNVYEVLVDDDFILPKNRLHINDKGYAYYKVQQGEKRAHVFLHRDIISAPKGKQVDHKNRNKLDNRKENLRLATGGQNQANRKARGYYKKGNKFQVLIQKDGKQMHIGWVDNEKEAREIYQRVHMELHGEFSPYYEEVE